MEGIRDAWVDFNGTPIHIGIAHGLKNARTLLEKVREGKEQFHAIEVMACPGGCIGGAGCLTHGEKNKAQVDEYGREAMEKTIGDAISLLK